MAKSSDSDQRSSPTPTGLSPDRLYRRCEFGDLDFETTQDLEDFKGLLGQPRAVAAVEFGIAIEHEGFNVFAYGPIGSGKHSAVQQYLERKSDQAQVPPDVCYVNNFVQPHCPEVLLLPTGRGIELRRGMARLVEELSTTLETALESEQYQNRRQALEKEFEKRQSDALSELSEAAGQQELSLVRTPVGMVFAPIGDDGVLSPEEFQELPQEKRTQLDTSLDQFNGELQKVMQQFQRWQREARERMRELNLEVSRFAVAPLFEEIRAEFEGLERVVDYLVAVENDVVENAQRITAKVESKTPLSMDALGGIEDLDKPILRRYGINVLVDHSATRGAPVIYEDNPTYQNLVGRIEHIPQLGTAVTDFNLIKPGALHRACGGYLLIDALKLLGHPYAYEGLKRALQSRSIRIESLGEALSLITTYSLEPQPVELSVKVVLLGSPAVYFLLGELDPEFTELFKVAADFDDRLDWTEDSQQLYARLIAKLVREETLRPFDRSGVARLIEHSARAAGDATKMSLLMSRMLDLMREADHCAGDASVVSAQDVQKAIDAADFRADRIRARIHEEILRDTVLVDTGGAQIGQVNGLSVLQLGDFSFGQPSRITARVRLGEGEVIDIEREVELSGPLHSKGVLILSGFLGARYAPDQPLSLSASLVFEQSYGGIDGDSASSAELYALLSAIAQVPIRQSLAVTGSVNQRGEIQAIGGVNEKIEGFFDICQVRGLAADHGVLIPVSNVNHLMLRRDVVDAVAKGTFQIYPVSTVDQGIELLTGVAAGRPGTDGVYPERSVNRKVADRLAEWTRVAQAFGGHSKKET